MTTAMAVIDIQNGFITDGSRHIVPKVIQLLQYAGVVKVPCFFTRFINHPESGHVKWIRWSRLMSPPEIGLYPDILPYAQLVFDKPGYTSFTPDVRIWIQKNAITRLYCCGIATESCVLKTAVDAFEIDIEPVVVYDACASHAGQAAHKAGLFVLSRFIGKGQLRSVDEVVRSRFT